MPLHTGYYAINGEVYYNGGVCFTISGNCNNKDWAERVAELLNKDARTPPSNTAPVASDPPAPVVKDEDDDEEPVIIREVIKGAHSNYADFLL